MWRLHLRAVWRQAAQEREEGRRAGAGFPPVIAESNAAAVHTRVYGCGGLYGQNEIGSSARHAPRCRGSGGRAAARPKAEPGRCRAEAWRADQPGGKFPPRDQAAARVPQVLRVRAIDAALQGVGAAISGADVEPQQGRRHQQGEARAGCRPRVRDAVRTPKSTARAP